MGTSRPDPRFTARHSLPKDLDLLCLSHDRWDDPRDRQRQLMIRHARERRVFAVEEPVFGESDAARFRVGGSAGVRTMTPLLPDGLPEKSVEAEVRDRVDEFLRAYEVETPILWYGTPMALPFTQHLDAAFVVYDCTAELFAPPGPSPRFSVLERILLRRADAVFTDGVAVYEAKRTHHTHVYSFPSGIDYEFFAAARGELEEPVDEESISRPRIGVFAGPDASVDLELVEQLARKRTTWQFVLLDVGGATAEADGALPASTALRARNIHRITAESIEDVPAHLCAWDVVITPYLVGERGRYASPITVPQALAAGVPVVSTPLRDVVNPYAMTGLVRVAEEPEAFCSAIEESFGRACNEEWLAAVDTKLAGMSWDRTFRRMSAAMSRLYRGEQESRGSTQRSFATVGG